MDKVELSLPVLSSTKIVICNCHVDYSTAGIYDMIICRDLLTKPGIDLKYSTSIIDFGEGTYQGCTTPMENLNDYDWLFFGKVILKRIRKRLQQIGTRTNSD